jgi:hypothetical protein
MFAQLTSCELTALTWNLNLVLAKQADLGGRTVWGGGVWQLACWDCAFESRRGHGCLSLVSVVCCRVQVSASG